MPRPDPRRQALRLLIALIAFGILVVGWRTTEIDLYKLFTQLDKSGNILRGLATPDIVTRETSRAELDTPFVVGANAEAASVATSATGQSFRITPGAATPGQDVVFEGVGFAPHTQADLRLLFPGGRDARFTVTETDARGNFREERAWPESVGEGTYTFRLVTNAPVGSWKPSETFLRALDKMGETILLALMGTVIGVAISVPLSFFGARNLMAGSRAGMLAYYAIRTFFNVGRSIEILIFAIIMAVIVGIGSFAGVMAIVLHSIGAMGKLYSEALESIDTGPMEAVTATGASRFQTIIYAVVPQVIPQFLAFTIYRWDVNLRLSTVIGLVGGGGIGFLLQQHMNLLQWSQAATEIWMIAIVVMALDYASASIRARLV